MFTISPSQKVSVFKNTALAGSQLLCLQSVLPTMSNAIQLDDGRTATSYRLHAKHVCGHVFHTTCCLEALANCVYIEALVYFPVQYIVHFSFLKSQTCFAIWNWFEVFYAVDAAKFRFLARKSGDPKHQFLRDLLNLASNVVATEDFIRVSQSIDESNER